MSVQRGQSYTQKSQRFIILLAYDFDSNKRNFPHTSGRPSGRPRALADTTTSSNKTCSLIDTNIYIVFSS